MKKAWIISILLIVSLSVSYTHLRAHETVLDLVCRLLLEKKNKKIFLKLSTITSSNIHMLDTNTITSTHRNNH